MSKFGARVVGKERAAMAQVEKKHHTRRFGSRVIGAVLARRHELAKEVEDGYDPESTAKKMAERRAAPDKAEASRKASGGEIETVEAPVTANLDELGEALVGNPGFFGTLFAAEKTRAGGPRKGALRLFLAHALEHEHDEEEVEEIQGLLKG